MMPVASCISFPFRSVRCYAMLTMFVRAAYWLSLHPYTLAHMSMHESCLLMYCPCFNTMKLWTFDPNLHLSLVDTTFCFLFACFVFFLVCLFSCFFACHIHHANCFTPFSYALCIFSFHCLSTSFLSLPLHVHTRSEDA